MAVKNWIALATGMCLPLLAIAIGQDTTESPQERERIAKVFDASAEALDKMRAQLHLETFDIPSLAKSLQGQTPAQIRDWMTANIRPAIYLGVLKGASGTLEDQRGNALDRALLLSAILKEQGSKTRLAHATLDPAAAEKLLAAADGAPPPPARPVADDQKILEETYADPRINGEKMRARIERENAEASAQKQAADDRVKTASEKLKQQTGELLAAATDDEAARRMTAAADHWWVQVNENGVWTDLDPDTATLGLIAASQTFESADKIPSDLRRSVTIRVVGEMIKDGAYARTTLLEKDFDPSTISGRVLILRHRAVDMKALADVFAEGGDFNAKVAQAAAASSAWVPMLAAGEDTISSKLVATNGDIVDATEEAIRAHGGVSDGMAGVGGSLGGAIDALGGDTPAPSYDENTGPAKFTAEFIEVETKAPGEKPRLERRAVFDLAGPAARARRKTDIQINDTGRAARGFALLDSIEIMVTTGRLAPERAAHRIQESYASAFRAMSEWIMANDGKAMPPKPEAFQHINLPLSAFAAGRMFYGPDGDARVQADTNAAMTRQGMRTGSDGTIKDILVFDIVLNHVYVKDKAARVAAGAADTVAEHVAVGAPPTSHNTAIRYTSDAAASNWTLIQPKNVDALKSMRFNEDAEALIAEDLDRGYAAIVPQQIASLDDAVWWRVDPATGETLGMNALGGSEFTEYAVNLSISIATMASCLYKAEKAGPNPGTAKQVGIGLCMLGATLSAAAAAGGAALWVVGSVSGATGVAGNFIDP